MKIEETLSIEISEIEEDYPDQAAEYKVQALQWELVAFVHRVADDHTVSEAECNAVEFQVAMSILKAFQGRCNSNLLGERIEARFSPRRKCSVCPHAVNEHGPGGCAKCDCKSEIDV